MERSRGSSRTVMRDISESIERGNSFHKALLVTGNYFPEVFREMVGLGVETGHLDRILKELANQYEHKQMLQRSFLAGIAWPMIQLLIAIVVVGILIFVMGIVSNMTGTEIDILGLGLIGAKGVAIYFSIVGSVFLGFGFIYLLFSRGQLRFLPLDRLALMIPGVGGALKTLALSKMAWAMALTAAGGMEVRRSIRMALSSTRNRYFMRHIKQIDSDLLDGQEIHRTLRSTDAFPDDFLDAIETGETSGKLSESMDILSKQYQDKARNALNILAMIGGVVVWLGVMAIIIMLIFKIFSFYRGTLNDALDMVNP